MMEVKPGDVLLNLHTGNVVVIEEVFMSGPEEFANYRSSFGRGQSRPAFWHEADFLRVEGEDAEAIVKEKGLAA